MSGGHTSLDQIAADLRAAEASGTAIPPIRDRLTTDADAYRVQAINRALRLAQGGRIVGQKIGLTNPAVQQQLGVDQPDYGMLFADMEVPHAGEIAWNPGAQHKVEAEIAFILGRGLPHPDTSITEVIASIDCAVPALEIVGSRIENWDIRFADTVADNASSAFFTLGPSPRRLDAVDLLGCRMGLTKNGAVVSEGVGRACLSSPLNAVQWLARTMAAAGTPLEAGQVVLSGALGPMVPAEPGATFTATIEGFGETAVSFGGIAA